MSERLKEILGYAFGILVIGVVILILILGFLSSRSSDETSNPGLTAHTPSPNGYSTCSDAHDEGVYDIPEGDPAYKSRQDADSDGYACEHYLGN